MHNFPFNYRIRASWGRGSCDCENSKIFLQRSDFECQRYLVLSWVFAFCYFIDRFQLYDTVFQLGIGGNLVLDCGCFGISCFSSMPENWQGQNNAISKSSNASADNLEGNFFYLSPSFRLDR